MLPTHPRMARSSAGKLRVGAGTPEQMPQSPNPARKMEMSELGLGRVKTTAEFCRIWFGDEIRSDEQFGRDFRRYTADNGV
jgi:hypothetical protein